MAVWRRTDGDETCGAGVVIWDRLKFLLFRQVTSAALAFGSTGIPTSPFDHVAGFTPSAYVGNTPRNSRMERLSDDVCNN